MNSNLNTPLVSITVITYNSSRFVIETLESIKAQTYKNIELIVSDDCSKDNTVTLVEEWINSNKERFVDARLITSSINTGISGNKNRANAAIKGEWLKSIAGDDVLDAKCCESNINLFLNKEVSLICSTIYHFKTSIAEAKRTWPYFNFPTTLKSQLKFQLIGSFINSPGVFIRSGLLKELSGFDIKYPFLEDDPFWIKALDKGYRFFYNPQSIVYYRAGDDNISLGKGIVGKKFWDSVYRFRSEIVIPKLFQQRYFLWGVLCWTEIKLRNISANGKSVNTFRSNLLRFILNRINRLRRYYFSREGHTKS